MTEATLCAMHRAAANACGARVAMRYKQNGLWHDISWHDVRDLADRAAFGLMQLGIQRADRVAILAENRFEWVIADLAVLSTGAAGVTMHAPLTPSQVAFQVSHSEATGIIVSNDQQAAKVFEVLDRLPRLQFLISFDRLSGSVRPPRALTLWTWHQLTHVRSPGKPWHADVLAREATVTPDDLATVIYTSGTTGNPKGVMLSHDNLLTNARVTGSIGGYNSDSTLLSWLPYSHIYARTVDLYQTMYSNGTLCVGGPVDELSDDLGQVHPFWMTAVPRFYEKIWSLVETLPLDERRAKLRTIFGARLDHLSSGGAPLPKHIAEGFQECGIPLYQGYGLTESSPVISFNRPGANRLGSVGQALPGVEVRIADDGEILTRGPHVMQGYWRDAEATASTIVDGWLLTGDVGYLDDDGYLFITDRKKDIIVTSGGKNIAPTELERLLISDPFIDQAVVYGDNRPFLTALIVPNSGLLKEEGERQGWPQTFDGEVIADAAVQEFFAARVAAVMQDVSHGERVRRFLLLNRPFSQEAGELTATLKVRRRFIVSQFEQQLASLYDAG